MWKLPAVVMGVTAILGFLSFGLGVFVLCCPGSENDTEKGQTTSSSGVLQEAKHKE